MVEYIGFGEIFNDMPGCAWWQHGRYLRHRQKRKRELASGQLPLIPGADETNRTSDLLITNQLLYRLSYISEDAYSIKKSAQLATSILIGADQASRW